MLFGGMTIRFSYSVLTFSRLFPWNAAYGLMVVTVRLRRVGCEYFLCKKEMNSNNEF